MLPPTLPTLVPGGKGAWGRMEGWWEWVEGVEVLCEVRGGRGVLQGSRGPYGCHQGLERVLWGGQGHQQVLKGGVKGHQKVGGPYWGSGDNRMRGVREHWGEKVLLGGGVREPERSCSRRRNSAHG